MWIIGIALAIDFSGSNPWKCRSPGRLVFHICRVTPRASLRLSLMMKAPLLVPTDAVYCCSSALLFSPWLSYVKSTTTSLSLSIKETERVGQDKLSCRTKSVSCKWRDLPSSLTYATTIIPLPPKALILDSSTIIGHYERHSKTAHRLISHGIHRKTGANFIQAQGDCI